MLLLDFDALIDAEVLSIVSFKFDSLISLRPGIKVAHALVWQSKRLPKQFG